MNKKSVLFLFLLILVTFLVYLEWWKPGVKVANDFPLVDQSLLKTQFNLPQIWSDRGAEGLGEYTVFTLWSWPLNFLVGFLANLGFQFAVIEKIVFFAPFILLGIWSMNRLGKYLRLSKTAVFFLSFFYLTNTYPILLMDGGQLSIGLAYSWFPFCFLKIIESIQGGYQAKISAGVIVAILGIFDIRYVYILSFLSFIYFLYSLIFLKKREIIYWVFNWSKTAGIALGVFILLNFYWILPLIFVPISSNTYQYITQTNLESLFSIGYPILLISPNWYLNVFGQTISLLPEFIFLPVIILLAPILKPRDKNVGFWLSVLVVSIFLAKGSAQPLPFIYSWFFNHIPGFSLFRDPTKFFTLIVLSYSVLLGIVIDRLSQKFNRYKIITLGLIFCYLIFLIRPVFLNQMTGTLSNPREQSDFSNLGKYLSSDINFGRVFWIPSTPPLVYSDLTHPIAEAIRLYLKRPFEIGIVGDYEVFNFIDDSNFESQLFNIAGIKYIVYPYPDPKRQTLTEDEKSYYNFFLNQLANLNWLTPISTQSSTPIFELKEEPDKFFLASKIYCVEGSDDLFDKLNNLENFHLKDVALVFLNSSLAYGKLCQNHQIDSYILNNKSPLDLAVDLSNKKILSLSQLLKPDPDITGWWERDTTNFIELRNFLHNKYQIDNQDFDYQQGYAISEGAHSMNIQLSQICNSGDLLFSRQMESTQSGEISFYQSNSLIQSVETKLAKSDQVTQKLAGNTSISDRYFYYGGSNFFWSSLGVLKNTSPLVIKTSGNINMINIIACIKPKDFEQSSQTVQKLNSLGEIIDWGNSSLITKEQLLQSNPQKPTLKYQYISPTRYKISITGGSYPTTLAFSENYDQNWKLDGENGFPLYDLINGYKVEKAGDYTLYFEPQDYLNKGLLISGGTLILLILYFSYKFFRKRFS